MTMKPADIKSVMRTFNTIAVMKGQYTNIATSDEQGNPNVAPIGSMRMVDETTVHILQGFLPKTMSNLRKNPKAVFSVCLRPTLAGMLATFREKEEDILGYQVYCTLTGETRDELAITREARIIARRAPFIFRRSLNSFCKKNLKRLLTFTVDDIRAIGAPE